MGMRSFVAGGVVALFLALPLGAQEVVPYVPKIDVRATQLPSPLATSSSRSRSVGHRTVGVFDLINPPVAADLFATEDAPQTPEIVARAASLGGDPVRIFNEVSRSILFEPYYGSRKGAHLTLLQRSGGAIDIANLLVALLRASGHPARYMTGRVTGSAEEMQDWLGVASASEAAKVLSSGGIPAKTVPLNRVEFEHAWVAVHAGGRWVELDATFKKLVVHAPAIEAEPKTPLPQFLSRVAATGALDVPNKRILLAPRVPSPEHPDDFDRDIDLVYERFEESLAASQALIEHATDLRDVFGYSELFAPVAGSLADQRPFRDVSLVSARARSLLPPELRAYLTIEIDPIVLDTQPMVYRASLPELAGKSITLLPVPATAAEEALIAERGGTMVHAPQTMLVRTLLSIDGVEVARGNAVKLNAPCYRRLKVEQPGRTVVTSENQMHAGDTLGVAIAHGLTSEAELKAAFRRLDAVTAGLPPGPGGVPLLTAPEFVREPLNGAMLYTAGLAYNVQLSGWRTVLANKLGVRAVRHAAVGWVLQPLVFDQRGPASNPTHTAGLGFDLPISQSSVWSPEGDARAVRAFYGAASSVASALEHHTWEALGLRSVSAVRALHLSMKRGVPIRSGITKANWLQINSQFRVSIGVLIAVTDAVNAGYTVTLPERNITVGDWTGTGFVVTDPATNASSYIISGGLHSRGEEMAFGGFTSDTAKMLGGLGLAFANLGLAGAQMLAGLELIMFGGPPGWLLGGALVAGGYHSVAETIEDLAEYGAGQSHDDFFREQLGDFLVDNILNKAAGKQYEDLLNGAMSREQLKAMRDLFEQGLAEVTHILADDGSDLRGAISAAATVQPLTEREVLLLALHSSNPDLWADLVTVQTKRGWAPVRNLVRNRFYREDRAIIGVARALARAPEVPGAEELVLRASEGPSYTAAYAMAFEWGRAATRFGRGHDVTYTPVTGFAADGSPLFGPPAATTLAMPVEIFAGQWFYTQHAPVGRSDLRAWNAVMKLKAAADAGSRALTMWVAGGADSALRQWTAANAPQVRIDVFQDDSLR